MTELPSILREFHADLDRAADLLDLIRCFRVFAGSTAPAEVADDSVPWPEGLALAQIAPQVRTDLPIMSGSILLYLCGRFENFIREVVIAVGDDYASKATTYEDLPLPIRTEVFNRTLEVARSPTKYNFETADAENLIRVLADSLSVPAGAEVIIDSRLLAITDANMHSRMLAEIFKRVGIDNFWRELGKQAPVKNYLGKAEDGECTAAASARIDTIMKERNGIAHPTASTSFPDPDQVQDTVNFLRIVSSVVVDLAQIPR